MTRSSRFLVSLVLTFAFSSAAFGQPPGWHHVYQGQRPAAWNPAPQETFVAYWTLEPGWSTRLEIRNNVTGQAVTVTPALRVSSSNEVALAPVTIQPEEVAELDLCQGLRFRISCEWDHDFRKGRR